MASLSDQIDRLTRSTRRIRTATAPRPPPTPFTDALLALPITAAIRDADPAELGLFALAGDADPRLARATFPAATPLRRNASRNDTDPEVYANAALKCVSQYAQIRPMPRAHERIVAVLDRLQSVRASMSALDASLRQTAQIEDAPQPQYRIDEETRRIADLQAKIRDLSLKKDALVKSARKAHPPKPAAPTPPLPQPLATPGSPEEDNFWNTPMGPSRILKFSDNLMDEHVDLGDISMEFNSPAAPSPLVHSHHPPPSEGEMATYTIPSSSSPTSPSPLLPIDESPPKTNKRPRPPSSLSETQSSGPSKPVDTPRTRQRKLNNVELDRTVKKLWETLGDLILPHSSVKSMPVSETISHIQKMASTTPQPDSPIASSVSSIAIDANSPPSAQQVLTAHLLVQLLTPPYTVPLKQLKENIMLKAQTCGVMNSQGRATQIVFNCVAKGLVKIDRSSREQFVQFDI